MSREWIHARARRQSIHIQFNLNHGDRSVDSGECFDVWVKSLRKITHDKVAVSKSLYQCQPNFGLRANTGKCVGLIKCYLRWRYLEERVISWVLVLFPNMLIVFLVWHTWILLSQLAIDFMGGFKPPVVVKFNLQTVPKDPMPANFVTRKLR